jgi:BMFP domain-containing protein YqiC
VDMMKQLIGAQAPSQPRAQAEPELDALRKRVAELEARLEKPARGKRDLTRKRKGRV